MFKTSESIKSITRPQKGGVGIDSNSSSNGGDNGSHDDKHLL